MAIQIDSTANYAVYMVSGTVSNGRVYFEHLELGDERSAVAIVKNNQVVDLDGCYDLSPEQRAWLTGRGIAIDF